jgi:redox-sensitive bicupin YhaK (pirin superfamily)
MSTMHNVPLLHAGSRDKSVLDPFLMLDHLGPVEYRPGEAVGAPDHPHRGFETVWFTCCDAIY